MEGFLERPVGRTWYRVTGEGGRTPLVCLHGPAVDLRRRPAQTARLSQMTPGDRALGKRIHAIVTEAAPDLVPKTWYGMPAYANKDGKVVVFFRDAGKFKERYAMLGFNDSAKLDAGSMWPVAFALTKLTAADEAKIRALVKKAVG